MNRYFVLIGAPPGTSLIEYSGECCVLVGQSSNSEWVTIETEYIANTVPNYYRRTLLWSYPISSLKEITEEQYNNHLFRALAKATYGNG